MSAKKADALEAFFTLASMWLALRGEDAQSIAARALAAANAAETTRKRLEQFVMGRVREAAGCQKPNPCSCLVCAQYEADAAAAAARQADRSTARRQRMAAAKSKRESLS